MGIFEKEKLPYLLISLFSLIGLVFTNFSDQLFYKGSDIIEYTVNKTSEKFDPIKKVWFYDYQYTIKNISDNLVDTIRIDFVIDPDTLTQKNIVTDHTLKPVGATSIKDVSIERIARLGIIQIWNYLPDATYQYDLKIQSISKDLIPQISLRANQAAFPRTQGSIRLEEKNTRTWLVQNKLLLSIICLAILISAALIYIFKLNKQPI